MAGALKRGLAALVLSLAVGLLPLFALGGCGRQPSAAERIPAAATPRTLQEVAPPAAVLQLKAALDSHQPRVSIQAPADGTLLPPGPWELAIQVRDWPLVDAGPLGLGPHLVVQIDDQAPIRTTAASPEANRPAPTGPAAGTDRSVRLTLDPLSPGSHRITAYAARPWGEAVKAPTASDQITVHRVAATPLTLPRSGDPQLRPVSPPVVAGSEPVLIDWLLRDAPLQHLRTDASDSRWRLRITINGDSFQVDRQMPLWLKGFRSGSNAVVLELLDGLGEPITPTLNTLVQEVIVRPGERPAWNGPALAPDLLAALLGQAPAAKASEPPMQKPPSAPGLNQAAAPGASERLTDPTTTPLKVVQAPLAAASPDRIDPNAPDPAAPAGAIPSSDAAIAGAATIDPSPGLSPASPGIAASAAADPLALERSEAAAADGRSESPERPLASGNGSATAPSAETATPSDTASNAASKSVSNPETASAAEPPPDAEAQANSGTAAQADPSAETAVGEQPLRTAPPVLPPARSELNDDGSVIRPKRQGLLSGLRGGGA